MVMLSSQSARPERVFLDEPIVTRMATIMHGGWDVDGAVWASGIKDVAWLSYKSGKPLQDKMQVEKCISAGTEQAHGADSP